MAREVPSAPKVYTTKYDNFRGVDFTNDPSNVWSHRSPNAVNMMPDLSGSPWKRTGWKIELTTQDFKDCYNTTMGYTDEDPEYYTGSIIPIKTNYFEIGGEDYLAISNNLGLFVYSKFIGLSASDSPYLKYIKSYNGEVGTSTETQTTTPAYTIVPNPNRAFFFEGKGTAGFYVFCTINATTSLFRFDGEILRMTNPYVPRVVISRSAGSTDGVFYESPNILTLERIAEFTGDGTTKDFILPEKADTGKTIKVEVLTSGQWTTKTYSTDYDYSHIYDGGIQVTKISFTNAPASGSGEDNVRVTYSIVGNSASTTSTTKQGSIKVGTRVKKERTIVYNSNGTIRSQTPWATKSTETIRTSFSSVIPNLVMSNNMPDISVYLKSDASTWSSTALTGSYLTSSYNAYTDTLTVNCPDPSGYYYTTTTETSTITQSSPNVSPNEVYLYTLSTDTTRTVTETQYITTWKTYPIKVVAIFKTYSGSPIRDAFESCIRSHVFGDGIINSVFMAGATIDAYRSRVWWSATADPTYFPDTNYFEAGSNDTRIAGLIDVGEYLGVIKQGESTNSTIYLAYQTKVASGDVTEGDTTTTLYDVTYGVKTSIGGVGAISNGAFNILNSEPLFLSREGIMGINPLNENEKQLRNRSYFVNKRLLAEADLENAFSFVWRNMYILAVNNHCYLLDGSQKSSWANEKTNLQYECYYWENVPAQCFARYNEQLWFTDHDGRLCRFKEKGDTASYHDEYDASVPISSTELGETSVMYGYIPVSYICDDENVKVEIDIDTFWSKVSKTGAYVFALTSAGYLHRTHFGHHFGNSGNLDGLHSDGNNTRSNDSITMYFHDSEGWHIGGDPANLLTYGITITEGSPVLNTTLTIVVGCPIRAKWTTVLDDDGSANYFKTLQKKGTMAVLYPQSSTGVKVYIKKDNAEPIYVGKATVRGSNNEITAPSDFYLKKKAKKYKRLQIIAENDGFDETFGIDEIIKCYTIGNYSRNR